MRCAASSGSDGRGALSGSSASTTRSMSSAVSSPSPYVHGIERFTCATTSPPRARQASTAAGSTLTSVPIDQVPSCGAETCRHTTSGGSVVENSRGTSDSRAGT